MLADRLLVLEDGRIVQEGTPGGGRPAAGHRVRRPAGRAEPVRRARSTGRGSSCAAAAAFVVPDHGQHGDVLVALRPSAVVVSLEQPHTSARNTWPATIVGLTLLTDRVRIDLDGEPSAFVDVTPAAVAELELTSGGQVWLSAKATDLEVYGGDSSVDTGGPSSPTRRYTRDDAVGSGESVTSTDLAGRDRES